MSLITAEYANILEQARLVNYATPFFYTSRDILKKNYHTFTHLFDDVEIYYALKANSDPKILAYLNSLGCGFEAASAYEIEILIDLGVEASNIVYGTSIKPAEHIKLAYQAGVKRFAADSKEEIKKIADNAPGAKVFIRTIVDDGGSVCVVSELFRAPFNSGKDLNLCDRCRGLRADVEAYAVGF